MSRVGVGHPTIHSAEQAMDVLDRFHSMLVLPSSDEGFERIFHLDLASQSLSYTAIELQNILSRVASSPALAPQRDIREFFRPESSRGGRAWGGARGRRPFGTSFSGSGSFSSQDGNSNTWRRGGYGRDSASQSHNGVRVAGRGRGYKDYADAGPGFRSGRAFGGRSNHRGAGVTAQYGTTRFEMVTPHTVASDVSQDRNDDFARTESHQAGESSDGMQ